MSVDREFYTEVDGVVTDAPILLPVEEQGDHAAVMRAGYVAGKAAGLSEATLAHIYGDIAKYSPEQPRHPKGTPEGGRWSGGAGSVETVDEDDEESGEPKGKYKFDDFESAGIELIGDDAWRKETAEAFNEQIAPFASPYEFANGFTGGDEVTIRLGEELGYFTVEGEGYLTDDGEPEYRFERLVDMDHKVVDHKNFHVDPSRQGEGLGRHLLASQVALYEKLGIERVNVSAADVGRYAWARMGFTPVSYSWDSVRTAILMSDTSLLGDDTLPEGRIGESTSPSVMALATILRKDDPRAMWALVDSTYGKTILTNEAEYDHAVPSWEGVLRLNDSESMARFNSYVGRSTQKAGKRPFFDDPYVDRFFVDFDDLIREVPTEKYDPAQPRHPAGTPEGGRWASTPVAFGGIGGNVEIKTKYESLSSLNERNAMTDTREYKIAEAVADYGRGGYDDINAILRGKPEGINRGYIDEDDPSVPMYQSELDEFVKSATLSEDVRVFRLMRGFETKDAILDMKPGDVLTDLGYTSVAMDGIGLENFADQVGRDSDLRMEILLPAGTSVGPVYEMQTADHLKSERELLLPRGSRFRYIGDHRYPDERHVYRRFELIQ